MGSCEHGNEPSDCIKCDEFLDWLRNKAFQEEPCSMEVVFKFKLSQNQTSSFMVIGNVI